MPDLGDAIKRITNGDLGAEPPAAGGYGGLGARPQPLGDFCKFLRKKAILIPLDHISHIVHSYLKELDF